MQFFEDDETGDCCSSGPQHSTPIKSRNRHDVYLDSEDRNEPDCGRNRYTVRLTREKASAHLSDHINSTSIAIMKHDEGDEASFGKMSRLGLPYNLSSILEASKAEDTKDKIGTKAGSGLNICNNSVCTAVFRDRNMECNKHSLGDTCTLTAHIEQDIVNKQRREIQLLMEELAIRDQELNDLVSSHQSQVQAWEKDRDKLKEMQEHLKNYEADLRNRDFQLKTALSEMRRVCEQKKDDVLKLHKTEQEMERLTKQIKDNSVLFKEMENQNKSLMESIKKLISDKESLEKQQRHFVSALEKKDKEVKDKSTQMSQMKKHFESVESRIQTLKEENANLTAESHAWKQKYCLARDNADEMASQIEMKDENIQRVTQQLQESLQQAIALQKALFTSNEREKCKEEVLESLRKQQKRTMQELANLRELYERQSKDVPLYHLSIQEKKDSLRKDGRRDFTKEDRRRDKNMSYHMDRPGFLQHEVRDQSSTFLVKTKVNTLKDLKVDEDELEIGKEDRAATPQEISEDDTLKDVKKNEVSGKKSEADLRNARHLDEGRLKKNITRVGWATIGTSTSDLRQAGINEAKPRSKSLPRISDRHSSPQSSYFSDQGRHQSSSVNRVTNTYTERTTRSRSTSPLPTHELACTSAKGTTVTSANNFVSQHFDHLQRNRRAKESVVEKRLPSRADQKTGEPCSNEKDFGKPQTLNNRVYESSSDISDTSLQERVNCLGELTPADSDGMCHELQRDLSKVSVDDLHTSYKHSSDKESSYPPLRHRMLSKSNPQSSSYAKTSEWLDKCMSVENENENTDPSQSFRSKIHREALKNKCLRRDRPEMVHRDVGHSERSSPSPNKTVSNSARNITQNHNSKCDRSSRRSHGSNENVLTATVSKGRGSFHPMNVECGSGQPRKTDNTSTEKLSHSCDENVTEGKHDSSSSPLSAQEGVTLSNARIFSEQSLYEADKSAHFTCSGTSDPRSKKNQLNHHKAATVPSNETYVKSVNEFKKPSRQRADINNEQQNVNSTAEAKAKENNISNSESDRSQHGFYNGNTSCNKSVRIQSPSSVEDVDKFLGVSEMNEGNGVRDFSSLKSALKPQNRKLQNQQDPQVDQHIAPYDEFRSPHRGSHKGYKEVQGDERDEFLERGCFDPASLQREENVTGNTQSDANVRNYYYEEKVSSGSETSLRKNSEERACPHAIAVHSFTRPFTSTKAPSLYKQLSYIHFSEQKKRYEWLTPEELKRSRESESPDRLAREEEGHHRMSSSKRAQIKENGRDINQKAREVYDNSNNNNNNDGSLLPNAGVERTDRFPYERNSVMEEESMAGMEKFHTHFNNIVKKLEFSSDSLLECSKTDVFDASAAKPSHLAGSSSFNELHRTPQCHSQDSGCRTTPCYSGEGREHNFRPGDIPEGTLNDLNQGVSPSLNRDDDVPQAVCMTESDNNNASSEADNNEAYFMSLPDYFPDISSVTAADSDSNVDKVQDDPTDELETDKGGEISPNEPFRAVKHGRLEEEDCDVLTGVTFPEYMQAAEDSDKAHESPVEMDYKDHSLLKDHSIEERICSGSNGILCEELCDNVKSQEIVKALEIGESESFSQLNIDSKRALPIIVTNISEKSVFKHNTDDRCSPGEICTDMKHSPEYTQQTSPFINSCDKQKHPRDKSEKGKVSTSPLLTSKPSFQPSGNIPKVKETVSKFSSVEMVSADESSDKFTDRLSTFLEDSSSEEPEETSHIPVPMSPASKLHRLLVESQEMIRCFEKSQV